MCEVKVGDRLRFAVGMAVVEGTYQTLKVVGIHDDRIKLKCVKTGFVSKIKKEHLEHDLKTGILKKEVS